MRIGALAKQTGVTIDTIRFYEKKQLLNHTHVQRSANGYRDYTDAAIERMEMIKHAQTAGFTLTEIGELFDLWEQNQLSHDVIVARLVEKQRDIAGKIEELEQIQRYITNKIYEYMLVTPGPEQAAMVASTIT